MENQKVLTKEELDQVKEVQDLYSQVIVELGQIDIQINDLNKLVEQLTNQKITVLEKYDSTQQKEKILSENLSKKYGDGRINPTTGEFISSLK